MFKETTFPFLKNPLKGRLWSDNDVSLYTEREREWIVLNEKVE